MQEAMTAIENTKYEMNSSRETLCHVLVMSALKTYENSATATSNIIMMWYVTSAENPTLGIKNNGAATTINIVVY